MAGQAERNAGGLRGWANYALQQGLTARAVLLASVVIQLFSTNYCATRFSCSIKVQAGNPEKLGSAAARVLGCKIDGHALRTKLHHEDAVSADVLR